MPFDRRRFAQVLDTNAGTRRSRGQCAKYVRLALEDAGFGPFPHPVAAKRYGPVLLRLGFLSVPRAGYGAALGDVVVIQAITGHVYGHIAGYDGRSWVSDFVQQDFWPARAYKLAQAEYALFRYPA